MAGLVISAVLVAAAAIATTALVAVLYVRALAPPANDTAALAPVRVVLGVHRAARTGSRTPLAIHKIAVAVPRMALGWILRRGNEDSGQHVRRGVGADHRSPAIRSHSDENLGKVGFRWE